MINLHPKVTKFFEDKDGNLVIWQKPNWALWGGIIFWLLALVFGGTPETALRLIGSVFLLVWAYMEITDGDSPFRKLLGVLVVIDVLWQTFIG